jgi:hypothetical protein
MSSREKRSIARVEVMLAVAEHTAVDLDAASFAARRLQANLAMLDAVEPARRSELEQLASHDFGEIAAAYKSLKRIVEHAGDA